MVPLWATPAVRAVLFGYLVEQRRPNIVVTDSALVPESHLPCVGVGHLALLRGYALPGLAFQLDAYEHLLEEPSRLRKLLDELVEAGKPFTSDEAWWEREVPWDIVVKLEAALGRTEKEMR